MALAVERQWAGLGRKSLPKGVRLTTLIGFRIDDATTKLLDAEVKRQREAGLLVGRGDLARQFLTNALKQRRKKK
ncbi:MAG: hypothetical protein JWM53_5998 [bacterium]|nr:hypothetical protein [bacterium]